MWEYRYTDELYHYGIKGMKWGVRRFQDKDGSLTSAGKKRYSDDKVKSKKQKEVLTPEEEAARKARMKKRIKIGAAVVGTALAAYGGYKAYELYTGRKQKVDLDTEFRLLDREMTDAEHLNAINPGRIRLWRRGYKDKEIIGGSSANCMLCTTTYDLRKRGYDVHAGKSWTGYKPDDLFPQLYKNYNGTTKIYKPLADFDKVDNSGLMNRITDSLKNEGSGSRGNIVVWWKHGGGHSMIWENVDGKIKFMDGQTGREYKNFTEDILKHVDTGKAVELLRTDNLEINVHGMRRYMNKDTLFKTYVDHGAEIALKMATDPVVVTASGAAYLGYDSYSNRSTSTMTVKKNTQTKGGRK